MRLPDRWLDTWRALGAPADDALLASLLQSYAEPHRHYHTVRHLEECFEAYAPARSTAERPGEVELALWFHDAIYDTHRHDNAQRSADRARASVQAAGLGPEVAERIHALVMATRHDAVPSTPDAQLLVDVDLSILGAEPLRFEEYERQVREEYAWVPDALFRQERRRILEAFLRRPRIYQTQYFYSARENSARSNLERSIDALQG